MAFLDDGFYKALIFYTLGSLGILCLTLSIICFALPQNENFALNSI